SRMRRFILHCASPCPGTLSSSLMVLLSCQRSGDPRDLHFFPYTTLFRSITEPGVADHVREAGVAEQLQRMLGHPLAEALARAGEDRKSTRLNSSHGSISYAVFCLKKKRPPLDNSDSCWLCERCVMGTVVH